jgi:microcystin-dependent protein
MIPRGRHPHSIEPDSFFPRVLTVGENIEEINDNNGNVWDDGGIGLVPPGALLPYAGVAPPFGWLLCNGGLVFRADYPRLFAAIGTTYNVGGEPGDKFRLPNLQDRVPVGVSGSKPLASLGGEESVTLTPDEMPNHSHAVDDPGHAHTIFDPGHGHQSKGVGLSFVAGGSEFISPNGPDVNNYGNPILNNVTGISGTDSAGSNVSLGYEGGGNEHENMPPYIALNYIIRTG